MSQAVKLLVDWRKLEKPFRKSLAFLMSTYIM